MTAKPVPATAIALGRWFVERGTLHLHRQRNGGVWMWLVVTSRTAKCGTDACFTAPTVGKKVGV